MPISMATPANRKLLPSRRLLLALLLPALVALDGCSTARFYAQAISGQTSLLVHRRAIDAVLADPGTSEALKHKLELAQDVRAFARRMGLSVGGSYSQYEDIHRPYVVWNVFAAPEFSLDPKLFCYPIAGCVSYRGYFDERDAKRFAQTLRAQGFDVYVGGVAAYSTLGWFDDPILSTFVQRSDSELAALLFHELAHKTIYVKGDTRFNESYATTVEQTLLRRWLRQRNASDAFAAYQASRARLQQVIALIEATNHKLAALYGSDMNADAMRHAKADDIERLRKDYKALRNTWGDHDEFAWWMRTDINNAKLSTIATYNDWVPGFKRLLEDDGGDMKAFLRSVKTLADMDKPARDTRLEALSKPAATTGT
ncbi:MAG TPA: aminopeptidase [Pseudomonadales bacterium]|nr:aminopeptidase [Pseudomonadales bacterium]